MAIIRKGDKKAEADLKANAKKQSGERVRASDEKKRKAGLESPLSGRVTNKTGTPKLTKVRFKDDKNDKDAVDVFISRSNSPVSGSAITKAKIFKIKDPKKRNAALKKFTGK